MFAIVSSSSLSTHNLLMRTIPICRVFVAHAHFYTTKRVPNALEQDYSLYTALLQLCTEFHTFPLQNQPHGNQHHHTSISSARPFHHYDGNGAFARGR